MGMLIASEATLFGAFIGTYYYLRLHTPRGRRPASGAAPRRAARPCRACWRLTTCRCGSPCAPRAGPPAARAAPARRARRAGRLLRLRGARLRRPAQPDADRARRLHVDLLHAARRRPRPRLRSALLFDLWLLARSSRAVSRPTGERRAGDHLVLVLRQRSDGRRHGCPPLRARHDASRPARDPAVARAPARRGGLGGAASHWALHHERGLWPGRLRGASTT